MPTDTSEKGLESLIMRHMTGTDGLAPAATGAVAESTPLISGSGWIAGDPQTYDRSYAIDTAQLFAFLLKTQPEMTRKLGIGDYKDKQNMARLKFFTRLTGEIAKRGVIDVLRHGIKYGPMSFDLFYGTPSPGNEKAAALFAMNRFSITRQLRYSLDETQRALDLCLFINGLPVITFELKNSLTKQTAADAEEQYKRDRDPNERLFEFGRCMVHFAVDDQEVRMCPHLKRKASWFLPFDQGWNDGRGNPPNPDGLKTDYLWKRILTPGGLTDILENYAQVVEIKNPKTRKKKLLQIFPRYHQLDVVRKLLADAAVSKVGKRYLNQHSAGSGKSYSIAWLSHQLIVLRPANDPGGKEIFDTIIVVTDRVILDDQIKNTIKQFTQVEATIGHAENSGDLRRFIESGKKIIITTVQKFPFVLDIGDEHRDHKFAIIIDEAHSSQGGKTSAAVSAVLGDPEDTINDALEKRMAQRKMLTNASYFAFTATPKNKTLEIFGVPLPPDAEGKIKHLPFHSYTMKQAIQEGFILDVLKSYTPVDSYYRLMKTVPGDPEYDVKKARKKLRRYVESNDYAIQLKAEIMVDHFNEQVIGLNKIGGQARAMVVTSGIERALQYFSAIRDYLTKEKSPYQAIVAFSGEHEYGGAKVTESSLNGFPSKDIADRIQEDPYRFLICADKFQTGYDEPLLHTMYVDKPLEGIKAVQTLSRLNRGHPEKHDVFVLDFMNNTKIIEKAFADYYRTTILSEETDPNKLHDLKASLDAHQVYSPTQVENLVNLFLSGGDRDKLDPILDACVAIYKEKLDEDGQVDFKGKAKTFCRSYEFLSSILPYNNADWEKLSIFLNFLIPKLPAPIEEDLAKGILEAIDMESYRAEKKAAIKLTLPDEDAEIGPVPVEGGGRKPEPKMEPLSNIIKQFNELFGNIPWTNPDRAIKVATEEIPAQVSTDTRYRNAKKQQDYQNARIEHDEALKRVITALLKDDTELCKQFYDNESFRRWLADTSFAITYPQ